MLTGPSQSGGRLYSRAFCKTYGCPTCGKLKAAQIGLAIKNAIEKHGLWVFATLTLNPKDCTPETSVEYIKRCWNRLRLLQRREFEKNISFISVTEFQKNTRNAHLHVLFSENVPFSFLKSAWRKSGGGSVDVRAADLGAANYLKKYLTKEVNTEIYGKFRRVSCSRDIKLNARPRNSDFSFTKESYYSCKYKLKDSIEEVKTRFDIETGFTTAPGFIGPFDMAPRPLNVNLISKTLGGSDDKPNN
jgi:hypothetical protein